MFSPATQFINDFLVNWSNTKVIYREKSQLTKTLVINCAWGEYVFMYLFICVFLYYVGYIPCTMIIR